MKKTVKKTPAYLTLYEQLKKEIVSGAYSYKSKLPSKRSAAERFGVSLVTIEHTYALLEDEGYIQGRQRCGYFVRYRKEQFFPSAPPGMPEKTQPEEFSSSLSLHSKYTGEPSTDQTPVPPLETDCFPPSVYAKAVRRVLSVYGDRILLKTENAGLPLLREAIARYLLRTRTISVFPDQIVIGSCTNGRIEDMEAAYEILKGRHIAKGVRGIIIPATMAVYKECILRGYTEAFIDAGCIVSTPTCGPCLGGYMGILAAGERCVSTTNRNFVGRMGHVKSEVYLASPATAAASALTGYITDPRTV